MHWIYVLGEEDSLLRPDGTAVPFTPGEDLLRVSYDSKFSQASVTYQYMVRRVAKRFHDGTLLKTATYYNGLSAAAARDNVCHGEGALEPYIDAWQSQSFLPSFELPEFQSNA